MLGRTFLACATFVVAAVAQSRIAFTVLPTNIVAGQPVTIQWGGGDNSPVTLILQQGTVNNLQTVELITGSATGTSYTWTPQTSLPNADNYALKIVQGDQPPNYTGMIALTGGSTSGPTNAISALASSTASGSSSASIPTNPASGGVVGGGSNSSNATTTMAMGTGAVGTGASGSAATGTAMSRNTTMSMATLSSSASMASKLSASSASAASATATSSSGSGSGSGSGSSTSSGTSPSSSSKSGAVSVAASNFALLCAAVVGVAYLG